jgi:hypothetical protein
MTCNPIAREHFGKYIPRAMNTQATTGQLLLLCNSAVNTTLEEAVFYVWLLYIHCWSMDVFSMGPPPDYISSTGLKQIRVPVWRRSQIHPL